MSTIADSHGTPFAHLSEAQMNLGFMPRTLQLGKESINYNESRASGRREYAVLMLFSSSPLRSPNEPAHLVFIKRSTSVRTHKGQISFPGGGVEPHDMSPEDTAIRETCEEIGVDPQDITIVGQLPLVPSIDASRIVPVVGVYSGDPKNFVIDPNEVDYAFTAPWTDFRLERSRCFTFNMFGQKRTSCLFESTGHRIWGLTAGILVSAGLA